MLELIFAELILINRKLDAMANELSNLQAAAAAAIALIQDLAAKVAAGAGGVAAADVQAVTDQLTAAVSAASTTPTA